MSHICHIYVLLTPRRQILFPPLGHSVSTRISCSHEKVSSLCNLLAQSFCVRPEYDTQAPFSFFERPDKWEAWTHDSMQIIRTCLPSDKMESKQNGTPLAPLKWMRGFHSVETRPCHSRFSRSNLQEEPDFLKREESLAEGFLCPVRNPQAKCSWNHLCGTSTPRLSARCSLETLWFHWDPLRPKAQSNDFL